MEVLKNRAERKAFVLGANAYKKAKRLSKKQGKPFACYLTLQVMNILQQEASRNLFVWHKLQELEQRAKRKETKKLQQKEVKW